MLRKHQKTFVPTARLVALLFLLLTLLGCGLSSGSSPSGGSGNNGGSNGGGSGGNGGNGGGGGSGGGGGGGGTTADFYVATEGKDSWSGTLPAPNADNTDGPFASIAQAQSAVRGLIQNPQGRTSITVDIREGEYFQPQALLFTSADSGTSTLPVIWENYPGETPVIDGGVRITGWTNTSGNTWQVRLPASTSYFENLWYNGQRRLRPRLGATSTSTIGSYFRIQGTVSVPGGSDANCPATQNYVCFDRFYYDPNDPISGAWSNVTVLPDANGDPVNDIELQAFEFWTVPKMRIKSIDQVNHIIYTTGSLTQNSPDFGFIPTHRYVIENVKDLLSQPGQWFLDRSTSPWTLNYLAQSGENPNTDTVIIPHSAQVFVANGLQYVTFKGITFANDNWTIPQAGYLSSQGEPTVPAAVSCQNCQNVTLDGDTVTQMGGAGFEFVTTDPSSATVNDTFENGAVFDVGVIGIRVGQLNVVTDNDTNDPHSVTVQNNVIQGYSRIIPSGVGIIQGTGHDNLYTHNDVSDGYHSAIAICVPGCAPGNRYSNGVFNTTVSFNHAWNIMKGVTDDGGTLYFATGSATFSGSGNKLLNNKVHDVNDASIVDSDGMGGQGIYLDFQTGLIDVENNLVYRTSANSIFVSKGIGTQNTGPNTIKNNIFAYSQLGIVSEGTPTSWLQGCTTGPTLMFHFTNNILYFDRKGTSPGTFDVQRGCAYACGGSYNEYQDWQNNIYWRTDGAFASDTTAFHFNTVAPPDVTNDCQDGPQYWTFVGMNQWQSSAGGQQLNEDAGSIVVDPHFQDPTPGVDDFTLAASPGAGFVVFDPNAPGRTSAVINPPAVADTFPTAAFSTSRF